MIKLTLFSISVGSMKNLIFTIMNCLLQRNKRIQTLLLNSVQPIVSTKWGNVLDSYLSEFLFKMPLY